jgi:hypothetical protein
MIDISERRVCSKDTPASSRPEKKGNSKKQRYARAPSRCRIDVAMIDHGRCLRHKTILEVHAKTTGQKYSFTGGNIGKLSRNETREAANALRRGLIVALQLR